jgi:hypothetical protein
MRKKSEGKPKRLSVKKQPVKTVGGAKHLRQDITRIRQRDIPQDVARIRQSDIPRDVARIRQRDIPRDVARIRQRAKP